MANTNDDPRHWRNRVSNTEPHGDRAKAWWRPETVKHYLDMAVDPRSGQKLFFQADVEDVRDFYENLLDEKGRFSKENLPAFEAKLDAVFDARDRACWQKAEALKAQDDAKIDASKATKEEKASRKTPLRAYVAQERKKTMQALVREHDYAPKQKVAADKPMGPQRGTVDTSQMPDGPRKNLMRAYGNLMTEYNIAHTDAMRTFNSFLTETEDEKNSNPNLMGRYVQEATEGTGLSLPLRRIFKQPETFLQGLREMHKVAISDEHAKAFIDTVKENAEKEASRKPKKNAGSRTSVPMKVDLSNLEEGSKKYAFAKRFADLLDAHPMTRVDFGECFNEAYPNEEGPIAHEKIVQGFASLSPPSKTTNTYVRQIACEPEKLLNAMGVTDAKERSNFLDGLFLQMNEADREAISIQRNVNESGTHSWRAEEASKKAERDGAAGVGSAK